LKDEEQGIRKTAANRRDPIVLLYFQLFQMGSFLTVGWRTVEIFPARWKFPRFLLKAL
jgi:hypothetical protein